MDKKTVDELVKKMHEKEGETVEYLQNSFSEEELANLNKQVAGEIHLEN